MKKLITILCLIPTISFAQKATINVSVGNSFNTFPSKIVRESNINEYNMRSEVFNPAASIGINLSLSENLFAGINATVFTTSIKHDKEIYGNTNGLKSYTASPIVQLMPSFGYTSKATEKIRFNAGVSAGVSFVKLPKGNKGLNMDYVEDYSSRILFSAGIVAGVNYSISKRFDLMLSVRPSFNSYKIKDLPYDKSFISVPVLLGVGFKI